MAPQVRAQNRAAHPPTDPRERARPHSPTETAGGAAADGECKGGADVGGDIKGGTAETEATACPAD